jgi:hypothetical protein
VKSDLKGPSFALERALIGRGWAEKSEIDKWERRELSGGVGPSS